MNMILTSECEKCEYGTIIEESKSVLKIKCKLKEKEYHFGQCIPCENKKIKKGEVVNRHGK